MRCVQELHLPTMRAQYDAVARQATAESWSYADYLLELARRECQQRQANRIERLFKTSKLPLEKSWQALDLKRLPAKVLQQLRSLLSGDFLDRRGRHHREAVPRSYTLEYPPAMADRKDLDFTYSLIDQIFRRTGVVT